MAKNSLKKLNKVPAQNIEGVTEELNNEPYHNETKLLNISFQSNIFSWVVLVIYMLNFLARIISAIGAMGQGAISNVERSPFLLLDGLYTWTNILVTPAMGFMFFLILQAISQGILRLMDIEENKSE